MESPPPFLAQFTRAVQVLGVSMPRHFQAILQGGLLGEVPTPERQQAAFFEIGCLHLYLMEHTLRRGWTDDTLLNEWTSEMGRQLLEPFQGLAEDRTLRTMLSWRLGRYEDVTRNVEADNTYGAGNSNAKLQDYLFCLTEQLDNCFRANASVEAESLLFLGVVKPDAGADATPYAYLRELRYTLYEQALPVSQIAHRWAVDGPFYEKSVEELNQRAAVALLGATPFDEQDESKEPNTEEYIHARWSQLYDNGASFWFDTRDGSPAPDGWGYRQAIELGADEQRYLWITTAEKGVPLRKLLLLAHDLGTGVNTWDDTEDEDNDRELPLSLGEVEILLRRGSDAWESFYEEPDLSTRDHLRISEPDAWHFSGAAQRALYDLYRDAQQEVERKRQAPPKQEGLFSRLIKRRKAEEPEPEPSPSSGSPLRVSLLEDPNGQTALAISPAGDKELLTKVSWLLPPGVTLYGEPVPNLARYEIKPSGISNVGGQQETLYPSTEESRARVSDPASRFVRAHQLAYGPTGEAYEVIQQARDDEDGQPLLDFALPCYDSSRGLALRGKDGRLTWRLEHGQVVMLLWDGGLHQPVPGVEGTATRLRTDRAATIPDPLDIPMVSLLRIASALRHAGVPAPCAGMAQTVEGSTIFCFGPTPPSPQQVQWAEWRVNFYLPRTIPHSLITNQPPLLIAPLP